MGPGCGDADRGLPFADAGGPGDTGTVTDGGPAHDVTGPRCRDDRDCDDGIACTDAVCVVGGVCEVTARHALCPSGQRCLPGVGCTAARSCTTDAQCDDSVPCTRDLCGVGGMCQSVRDDARCAAGMVCSAEAGCVAAGSCAGDGECDDGRFCNGTERCVTGRCTAGTPVTCNDNDPCTGDVCNDSQRRCDNPPINPCGGGTVQSGRYGMSPAIAYQCGSGAVGPVQEVTVTATPGAIELTGLGGVALRGAAPTGGMFSVEGREQRGPCAWRYAITGAFTAPGRFTGAWSLAFDNCSVMYGCQSQFGEVTGTLR